MPAVILCLFRFVRLLGSRHEAIALENLALRLQLDAFQRQRRRPVLTSVDRMFWAGLSRAWSGWRRALVFVQPDTVVGWQRERFRKFWAGGSIRRECLNHFVVLRPAPQKDVGRAFFLLPRIENPLGACEGLFHAKAGSERRVDSGNSAGRRPASPLGTVRGMNDEARTDLWRTAGACGTARGAAYVGPGYDMYTRK